MFRTPYRFCRITKEMIAALENEVETNLRLLKINADSEAANNLVRTLIRFTFTADSIGTLALKSLKSQTHRYQ